MAKTLIDLDAQAKLASATNQIIAANAIDNSKVSSSAAIAFSKLASLATGHFLGGNGGTVTDLTMSGDATISNTGALTIANDAITTAKILNANVTDAKLATAYIKADGTRAFTGDQSLGGFKITSLGSPSSATDAATKAYVDSVAMGATDWKASVRVATVGSTISLTGGAPDTLDGVALAANDRILVKDQSTASQNGLYYVSTLGTGSDGTWTRTTDADESSEVTSGLSVFVEEGSTYSSSGWLLITANPITLGTTALTFTMFTALGQITAGAGLTKTGNTLDVGAGQGIQVDADSVTVKLDGSTLTKSASGLKLTDLPSAKLLVGNGSNVATAQSVSGDLTMDNTGSFQIASGAIVDADINASAAIAFSKLAALPSTQILIGNGSNVATATAISGNATLSNAGVLSVTDLSISGAATGNLLYYNGTNWVRLATGTANQFLRVNTGATAPEWGNFVDKETPSGAIDSSNVTFTLANTPKPSGSEHVYLNGQLQESGAGNDYTISGATITFASAPTTGGRVKASYRY